MTDLRWLTAPDARAEIPTPPDLPPSPYAPDQSAVRVVRPGASGERLVVPESSLAIRHIYREMSFDRAPAEFLLRREVVDRLQKAQQSLPRDFSLTLLDGWRTKSFQYELRDFFREQIGEPLEDYVSDPADPGIVPPHTTGGAVDLTLAYQGTPLALGTDFDDFSPLAHLRAFEGDSPSKDRLSEREWTQVRELRRLLADVLVAAGFAPYPYEWWHWSYGDQWWAAHYGRAAAIYGACGDATGGTDG